MPINPPAGFDDIEGDADDHPTPTDSRFHELMVEDIGIVMARKPLPNALPALAKAANADLKEGKRIAYHERFVRNHVAPGEPERLLYGMVDGEFPADAYTRVSTAIATWGTARPT